MSPMRAVRLSIFAWRFSAIAIRLFIVRLTQMQRRWKPCLGDWRLLFAFAQTFLSWFQPGQTPIAIPAPTPTGWNKGYYERDADGHRLPCPAGFLRQNRKQNVNTRTWPLALHPKKCFRACQTERQKSLLVYRGDTPNHFSTQPAPTLISPALSRRNRNVYVCGCQIPRLEGSNSEFAPMSKGEPL